MVAVAEIPRPLGLILEEREDGRGVEIIRVDPRGNAALSRADVLVGDRVLMVGDAACGEGGFDEVAGLIGRSPDVVELTLGRALDVVRVEWPNGCVVGARPGDRMVDLAAKAGWAVRYSCTGGSCGTCEHRLRTGTGERYSRLCVARVPKNAPVVAVVRGDRY